MEHITVYYEPKRYAGWPANNGMWQWDGTEILPAFTQGMFTPRDSFHHIGPPTCRAARRSFDGSRTWREVKIDSLDASVGKLTEPVDFADPDLTVMVPYAGAKEARFHIASDRGAR